MIPCAKGTYSVEFATTCTACPPGTSTAGTLSTTVSQCLTLYNSGGSGGSVIPAICPQGYRCDGITRTLCAPGTYSPAGQPTCRTCPAGTWSPQGAGVCTTISAGNYGIGSGLTSQTICPAGYRCPTTTAQPIACQRGTYSPAGQLTCTACPTGTFTESTATASASQCLAVSGTVNITSVPNTRAVLLRNSRGSSLTTLTVGTSRLRCMINNSYTSIFTLQKITYANNTNTLYSPIGAPLTSTGTSSTNCEIVL